MSLMGHRTNWLRLDLHSPFFCFMLFFKCITTCVKSTRGISEHFGVGFGLHQCSALIPFLFIMLVDAISQDVRTELLWELLYEDDLARTDITITDTQTRLESWHNRTSVNKGNPVANETEWKRTE